jgi:hypothetical protein
MRYLSLLVSGPEQSCILSIVGPNARKRNVDFLLDCLPKRQSTYARQFEIVGYFVEISPMLYSQGLLVNVGIACHW